MRAAGPARRRRGGRRSWPRPTGRWPRRWPRFEAIAPPGPEEIFAHVFAEMTPPLVEQRGELLARLARRELTMARLNMVEAIDQALLQEMERDPKVVVLGEDVGRDGGVFRVTDGLVERFGEERVIDTPLAESGIVGMAIGMAIAGLPAGGRDPVLRLRLSGVRPAGLARRAHAQPQPGRVHRAPGGADALRRRASGRWSTTPRAWRRSSPTCPGSRWSSRPIPYEAKGLLTAAIARPRPGGLLRAGPGLPGHQDGGARGAVHASRWARPGWCGRARTSP